MKYRFMKRKFFYIHYGLSKREEEIVLKIMEGKSNKAIAKDLFIEEGTVKNHLNNIYKKTKVSRRLELVSIFVK